MLATPMTAGPVANSLDRRPTDSATVLCAGQNRSGTHCTTSLSSHSNLPVIAGVDLTATARSAARRLETGALNVITTGCATPTTAPRVGRTDAITGRYDWFAAMLGPAGPAMTLAVITIAARTHRTTAGMASDSFDLERCRYLIVDGRRRISFRARRQVSRWGQAESVDQTPALQPVADQ